MEVNDKQIDSLMRRYAQTSKAEVADGHLDADEMNSFAEGSLPAAARARYVSHLADCDPCRQQVSQLAITAGAVSRAETSPAKEPERGNLWQAITGLFALPALRYAAFAAVILVVGGVVFIALRGPQRPDALVASKGPADQHPASAVNEPDTFGGAGNTNNVQLGERSTSSPQPPTRLDQSAKADDTTVAAGVAASPQPMKESAESVVVDEKKAAESDVARISPTYAPPPPGVQAKQPAGSGGIMTVQEPRKAEPVDKIAAGRERSQGFLKDDRDEANRAAQPQSATQNRAVNEKAKGGPSRNLEMQANRNIATRDAPATLSKTSPKAVVTEEVQTRSAGGRKFRKQGNAWVDQKFKSSMTLKSVARGSDEFKELDSGLRSIAQQLGGEIIVVWKGKAYLIK